MQQTEQECTVFEGSFWSGWKFCIILVHVSSNVHHLTCLSFCTFHRRGNRPLTPKKLMVNPPDNQCTNSNDLSALCWKVAQTEVSAKHVDEEDFPTLDNCLRYFFQLKWDVGNYIFAGFTCIVKCLRTPVYFKSEVTCFWYIVKKKFVKCWLYD